MVIVIALLHLFRPSLGSSHHCYRQWCSLHQGRICQYGPLNLRWTWLPAIVGRCLTSTQNWGQQGVRSSRGFAKCCKFNQIHSQVVGACHCECVYVYMYIQLHTYNLSSLFVWSRVHSYQIHHVFIMFSYKSPSEDHLHPKVSNTPRSSPRRNFRHQVPLDPVAMRRPKHRHHGAPFARGGAGAANGLRQDHVAIS